MKYTARFFLSFFLTLFVFAPTVFSQEIHVVDLQEIISRSIAGKAAKNNFESEMKKSEQKLLARREEVARLQNELSKQNSLLSEKAREEKFEQLRKKQGDLDLAVANERDQLRSKYDSSLSELVVRIRETVQQIAEQNELKLVMDKDQNSVLFINPRFDITDKVIEILDKKSM